MTISKPLQISRRTSLTRSGFCRLSCDHFILDTMRERDCGDSTRLRDGDAAGCVDVGRELAATGDEVLGQVELRLEEELRNLGRFTGSGFSDEDDGVCLAHLDQEPEN